MSSRTIRRAIERQARKLEQKGLSPAPADRTEVNRANAQHSTGPLTSAGKAASSRNSLKHGLTGRTVLLDSDDAAEYQKRLDYYTNLYQPVAFEECRLVQAIHDANWRLDRIVSLESAIYAKGRIELADAFEDLPSDQRKLFIQLETSQRGARDLRNLHTQESRLQRQRTKDLAELKRLQTERREAEAEAPQPKPEPTGFVFATINRGSITHCQPGPVSEPRPLEAVTNPSC